ncbi:testis-expressed basic protein 1 isoform X111 [Canis lupus familiaris]|uniref:testis-expressed basic protein 1 isoform X111 n=1 Tax=Canis lupus familiaris TaxID=9615 RepID=UPI0018F435B9|nr:testis-expressed basic protein 1 isoform X111 [Canis lupus familiaris]
MAVLEITLAVILTLLGLAILAILLTRWTRRKQNEIDVSRYSSEQSAGLLDYEDGRGFRHLYSTESDASYDDQEGSKGDYTPSTNSLALSRSSIGEQRALLQGSIGDAKTFKATPEPLSGTAGPITGTIGPIMQFTAPIRATGPIKLSQKTIVQTPGPIVQYTGTSVGSTPQTNTGSVPPALTGPPLSMPRGVPLPPIMISQRTSTRPEKSKIKQEEPAHVAVPIITPVPIVIGPVAAEKTTEPCSRYSATRGTVQNISKPTSSIRFAEPIAKAPPPPSDSIKTDLPITADYLLKRESTYFLKGPNSLEKLRKKKDRVGRASAAPPIGVQHSDSPQLNAHRGNLKENAKTEVKRNTKEARKTPKHDIRLRIQIVPSQTIQSGPKYQHKGEISGPETYEKRQKQKTGVKIEKLPEKTQSKEERREIEDKRKDTEDMGKGKEIDKGQSKKGSDVKDKGEEEERVNMKKKGDEDMEDKDTKADKDKKEGKGLKKNKYKEEEMNKKKDKVKKGHEDKIKGMDTKGDKDRTEDMDKKGDKYIKEDENKDIKGYEDRTEDMDKKGDEYIKEEEDKDYKGDADRTEDMDKEGDEYIKEEEDKDYKGDEDRTEDMDKEGDEYIKEEEDKNYMGYEDRTEDIDTKGDEYIKEDEDKDNKEDEDRTEDMDKEGDEYIKEEEDKNYTGYEDRTEDIDTKGDEYIKKEEDKDYKGYEDGTEDMDKKGHEYIKEEEEEDRTEDMDKNGEDYIKKDEDKDYKGEENGTKDMGKNEGEGKRKDKNMKGNSMKKKYKNKVAKENKNIDPKEGEGKKMSSKRKISWKKK